MENASKALIIAGGILIGILTISLFYYMFNRVGQAVDSTSKNSEQEELLEFNKGFEIYNKKIMYGSDVISVINKAIDNNKRNGVTNDKTSPYYVDIVVTGVFSVSNAGTPEATVNFFLKSDFKTKTYRCKNVQYNSAGRICLMQFEEYGQDQKKNKTS